MALPGYRGFERAQLISLKLDKDSSSTGMGTYIEKGRTTYAEFKLVIRLCLVIKGWTKYS